MEPNVGGVNIGAVLIGNSQNMDFWRNPAYVLPNFGPIPGLFRLADSTTGPGFSMYSDGFGIYDGYVDGSPISGSMTFSNKQLSTLGMTSGSYVANLPSDTVTLKIGPVQIPAPATIALFGLALAGLGFSRTKSRRHRR